MKKLFYVVLAAIALLYCAPAFAQLEITEVASQNLTLRLDENGQAHDYVVITNMGEEAAHIGGYSLTNGEYDAYVFDNTALGPDESVIVYCTGQMPGAPFMLSAKGETLFLYDAQGICLQELSVPPMAFDQRYSGGSIQNGVTGPKNALHISELLAVNTLLPVNGETPDFIEMYNPGKTAINLMGYGLSDNPDKPFKWRFPDTVLPAGGYLAVYLTDADVGFGLDSDGECALLTDPSGKVLDYVSFGPRQNNVSLVYESGQWQETWTPTPGKENTVTGKAAYEQSVFEENPSGLYINEVVASNGTFDANGNSYDYVELYNASKKSIRLSDYFLSDGALNTKKWAFPKGAAISAGGYAVVYMAGRELKSSRSNTYYATFKIEKNNGTLLLCSGKETVDHVSLGRQLGNIAYGRVPGQGTFTFLERQTPKAKNPEEGFPVQTGDVSISPAGGLFNAPFAVTLGAEPDAVIRYTLDGSTPSEQSPVYDRPLRVNANTVLRARAFAVGKLSSRVSSATYLFGVHVSVPVVSLITDEKYLTDNNTGLLVRGNGSTPNYYQDWEYPMHVQYFDHGQMLINQLASFRTTGALGLTRPQKTISLFARGSLGEDQFYFNPFPKRDYDSYSALTLRSGGTESRGTRFKDELLTSLAQGLNVLYQDAVPVVVYINGQYWGHFNLRERINQDSIAQWEGVTDKEIIDGISILRSRGSVVQGSREEMNELIRFCVNKDLNVPENLQYVQDTLDVMSYFDHAILEIIAGNTDMHNVRYYKVPGGKWKLALFDMDGCMDNLGRHPLDLYLRKANEEMDRFYHEPFAALMRVPDMRELFLRRFGEILYEKFLYRDLEAKIDAWAAVIGPLMPEHEKRWPDTSVSRWQMYVDLLKQNARERPDKMVEHITSAFRLTKDEVQEYFGAFLAANKP